MVETHASNVQFRHAIFAIIAVLFMLHPSFMLSQNSNTLSGPPVFLPAVSYDSGGYGASFVTVADVNRDGKPDVIVTNRCSGFCPNGLGTVSVLLGKGDGSLQNRVTYSSGGYNAYCVAVADLNGDGKPDLVIANADSNTLGVMLGNGDGTFQDAVTYNSGGYGPRYAAFADINRDGRTDLVVANTYSNTVSLLLGNGDGTFRLGGSYDSSGVYPVSVSIDDVNGDGIPDLLVGNAWASVEDVAHGSVAVLLGNGDGSFRSNGAYSAASGLVAIADLNGDGKADAILGTSVLLGNGDGSFQSAVIYNTGGRGTSFVMVTDVDADGKADVVATDFCESLSDCSTGVVSILLGNGDGTLQPALTYPSGGQQPSSAAAADLNADGKTDLVLSLCAVGHRCGDLGNSSVAVLLNATPICTTLPAVTASASPASLWPPNGRMVPVTVSGKITDSNTGCTVTTAAYAVTDEYGEVQPTGPVTLGPEGAYSFSVLLPASRLGTDLDGRSYKVTVRASNNAGKTGSKVANVVVPHDLGH